MNNVRAHYHCRACGENLRRAELSRGAWGDLCCSSCGSPDVERVRSRWQQLYATFFLYKVY
jgi:ribosomal protein L37E